MFMSFSKNEFPLFSHRWFYSRLFLRNCVLRSLATVSPTLQTCQWTIACESRASGIFGSCFARLETRAEKTGCSRRLSEHPEPTFYILLTFSAHVQISQGKVQLTLLIFISVSDRTVKNACKWSEVTKVPQPHSRALALVAFLSAHETRTLLKSSPKFLYLKVNHFVIVTQPHHSQRFSPR